MNTGGNASDAVKRHEDKLKLEKGDKRLRLPPWLKVRYMFIVIEGVSVCEVASVGDGSLRYTLHRLKKEFFLEKMCHVG